MPGKYFDELEVGQEFSHKARHVITQKDNVEFCRLTLNTQPLHLDPVFARKAGFKDALVNGLLTFSTGVGMTVEELTAGTIVANLDYANVEHPNPVFPGDEIRAHTKVIAKKLTSKGGRGVVELETTIAKQDNTVVCRLRRNVLFLRNPKAAAPS